MDRLITAAVMPRKMRSVTPMQNPMSMGVSILPLTLRANGSRERAPDDRLRQAIHASSYADKWIASSLALLAMTCASSKTPNAVAIIATALSWIGVFVSAPQRHTRV
jgi:hypothetical protein